MNAPNGSPDDDPFATGGHGRFLDDGVAPPVIGAPPSGGDAAVRAEPGGSHRADRVAYDREPPTSPIPAQAAGEQKKPGFFGRLFGR